MLKEIISLLFMTFVSGNAYPGDKNRSPRKHDHKKHSHREYRTRRSDYL